MYIRLLLVILLGCCLSIPTAQAQWYAASYHPNAGNPGGLAVQTDDNIGGGWVQFPGLVVNAAVNQWSGAVALPFAFEFFGQAVTEVRATYNGALTFNAPGAAPAANDILPSAQLPNNSIACFWDEFASDGDTGPDDDVLYRTVGAAPNRQFWVRWQNMDYGVKNNILPLDNNFAVVLEETTHNIYLVDMRSNNAANLSTTVGLQRNANCAAAWGLNDVTVDPTNTNAPGDNDYYQFVPAATFTGKYQVGGANPNFPTFSNAAALLGCGISGPVELEVATGTYTEQVRIPAIGGVSATDTVWFHSQTGDSTDVRLTFPSHNDPNTNYTLFLDGADFVTFQGMTLERSGNDLQGQVVQVGKNFSQSTHNRFYRNRLIGVPNATQNSQDLLTTTFTPHGFQAIQNHFSGGRRGIVLATNFPKSTGVVVLDNTMTDVQTRGIQVNDAVAPMVGLNRVSVLDNNARGLELLNCEGPVRVVGNQVEGGAQALVMLNLVDPGAGIPSLVANNLLDGGFQAVILDNADNLQFFHNSLQAKGPASAVLQIKAGCTDLDLRNNLFYNANALVGMALDIDSPDPLATIFNQLDYNDYFITAGDLIRKDGVGYADLAAWQVASALDGHSLETNPDYDPNASLHARSPLVAEAGQGLPALPLDIYGVPRDPAHPSLGATEFTPDVFGTTLNTCVAIEPTVSTGSGQWQYLYAEGGVIAAINDNGNNLGSISGEVFLHNGPVRTDGNGHRYLDRNFHLTTTQAPATPVSLRLYFRDTEYNALAAADPLVTDPEELSLTRFSGSAENCDPSDNWSPGGAGYTTIASGLVTAGTLLGNHHCIQADIPGFSEFYISSTGVILPVEGLLLRGQPRAEGVQLHWQIDYAEQLSHFEVLRATDGQGYASLDEVRVSSPTLERARFDFLDREAWRGGSDRLQYRLRIWDLDGHSQLSEAIEVLRPERELTLQVSPNPTQGAARVVVQATEEQPVSLQVVDLQGRIVWQAQSEVALRWAPTLPADGWPAGMYLLRARQGGHVVQQRLLVN